MLSLWVWAVLLVDLVISIVATCLFYQVLYTFESSPIFITQLNVTIATTLPGIYSIADRIIMQLRRRDYLLLQEEQTTPPRPRPIVISKWTYLVLGFANSFTNFLQVVGIQELGSDNSNLAVLIQQAVIPVAVILTVVVLGKKYSILGYLGMALVLGGVGIAYGIHIINKRVSTLGAAMLFCSCIPTAGANIIIENLLGEMNEEPGRGLGYRHHHSSEVKIENSQDKSNDTEGSNQMHLLQNDDAISLAAKPRLVETMREIAGILFWENLITLLLNVPLSFAIHALLDSSKSSYATDIRDGIRCLFFSQSDGGKKSCQFAPVYVLAFAPMGVLFIVMQYIVSVYVGATASFLMVALSLPIQNYFLASRFLMGSNAGTFYLSEVYGLIVIIIGMMMFLLGMSDVRWWWWWWRRPNFESD